jgi:thiazole synthase
MTTQDSPLVIAGKAYASRLIIGSGKYQSFQQNLDALVASGAEMITVAIRRVNLGQNRGEPSLLEVISPTQYTILPNTAGCYNAADAVRTCRMARELLDGHKLVKLEVLGDQKTVYTSDDTLIAKRLEELGCVAVMPLGAPIGSGLGIRNPYNIRMILENATVPIIVDAGVGTASDAAIAMELGCHGVLMNTAIAEARNPVLMASAMKKAVESGREAFLAGRMPRRLYASASSPVDGTFF